ncbi:uncharacterized protein LOC114744533 [Neltuma alba]|uniref:uncharacterized protein LOC114744533 n=1 Tax=Neltuma alba TaxID=207710 RepID=UPI0010A40C25|nr:uncharacterized protein LOC114744533 [Prosopis alba]
MALVLAGKTPLIPPSQEEDDLLVRSSKKIKNGPKDSSDNILRGHWPKAGSKSSEYNIGGPSFAEKLKGVDRNNDHSDDDIENADEEDSDDSMSEGSQQAMEQEKDEPLCRTIEDPNKNFPMFSFSGKMKKKLYRAWRKAVIVKLLDRSIGYKALQSRLQSLWAKRGVINLINIGYGFFVVKLSNREDYFNALTGGPWMIYDHYLTVRPWEPRFQPARATIDKVAVWVRMPRVFLECYDEEALTIIGNRIGETIKVDMNTSCQLRGHYARICVLVDLGKQLMLGFSLDGEEYYLEYEGLHMLCSNCGIYGHKSEVCPKREKEQRAEGNPNPRATQMNPKEQEGVVIHESKITQDQWRVVHKPRRQRRVKENRGEANRSEKAGSRFGVLADVEEQWHEAKHNENVRDEVVYSVPETQKWAQHTNAVRASNGKKKSTGRRQQERENVEGAATWEANEKLKEQVISRETNEKLKEMEVSRKCEKRTREMLGHEMRSNEILMITMEECNEKTNEGKNIPEGELVEREVVNMMDLGPGDKAQRPKSFTNLDGIRIEEVDPGDPSIRPPFNNPTSLMQEDDYVEISYIGTQGEPVVRGFSEILKLIGRSGGIVAAWKSNNIQINVLVENQQFFHLDCEIPGKSSFFLTAIYAIPHSNNRQLLWNSLRHFSSAISKPWVVYGDFNDILHASERIGGSGCNFSRINWFQDRVRECGLSDLGFNGPRFTWKGLKISGCSRLYERLDRAFVNDEFLLRIPEGSLKVLPRTLFSDHNPLVLYLPTQSNVNRGIKPFRFEAMWLQHENFKDFLCEAWKNNGIISESLADLKNDLLDWNRSTFGFVEQKKRTILSRLKGIQNSSAYPFSLFLRNLEKELQSDLEQLLKWKRSNGFKKPGLSGLHEVIGTLDTTISGLS